MMSLKKVIAISFALSVLAVARGENARTNTWQMQVGWVHQWGRGMTVRGPALSSSSLFSSLPLGGRTLLPGGAPAYPDNSLLIARVFDDGYVSPDLWTADTGLLGTERYGQTWNWGANNSSQYSYNGGVNPTLSFHLNNEAALGNATLTGGNKDDNLPTDGVEIKFSRHLYEWTNSNNNANGPSMTQTNGNVSLDLVLGVAWFPEVKQHVVQQAGMGVYSVSETYTYSDYYGNGGSLPPLTVPYQGTYNGPGQLIPGTPQSSSYTLSQLGSAQDRVIIDSSIWRLRSEIGVTLTKEISQRWSVYVSPQFALEVVDMSATRSETLTYTDAQTSQTTVSSRSDGNQKTEIVPAFLINGGANYMISQHWFVGANVGWEQLTYTPSLRVGPDRVHFNIGGAECSVYVGRYF